MPRYAYFSNFIKNVSCIEIHEKHCNLFAKEAKMYCQATALIQNRDVLFGLFIYAELL